MRRLAGARALTGRHADQLRALSAPDALFLSIEPVDASLQALGAGSGTGRGTSADDEAVVSYCVRLNSLDRSATVVERTQPGAARAARARAQGDRRDGQRSRRRSCGRARSGWPAAAACSATTSSTASASDSQKSTSSDGRPIHLVLQMPRELMRYPWELLRDRHGWLVERFALGRQVIADADSMPRWYGTRRHGPLRFLVVAPQLEGSGAEVANVGILEGEHVARCFERLQERLPGLVEPTDFRKYIDTAGHRRAASATLLREGASTSCTSPATAATMPPIPERSCWMFCDGPLYAFELRHTLANAEVTPWLLYGSACEGSREAARSRPWLPRRRVRHGERRARAGSGGVCRPALEDCGVRRQESRGGFLRGAAAAAHQRWRSARARPAPLEKRAERRLDGTGVVRRPDADRPAAFESLRPRTRSQDGEATATLEPSVRRVSETGIWDPRFAAQEDLEAT